MYDSFTRALAEDGYEGRCAAGGDVGGEDILGGAVPYFAPTHFTCVTR